MGKSYWNELYEKGLTIPAGQEKGNERFQLWELWWALAGRCRRQGIERSGLGIGGKERMRGEGEVGRPPFRGMNEGEPAGFFFVGQRKNRGKNIEAILP